MPTYIIDKDRNWDIPSRGFRKTPLPLEVTMRVSSGTTALSYRTDPSGRAP